MSKIIGIDLGTTNSEVAVMENGRPKCIPDKTTKSPIIPSVVGISPITGELVVGEVALNQYKLHPENTIRSIKRKMGTNEKVTMAGKEYSPPEISAILLRYLRRVAEDYLGEKVEKAVITVPAYFSDAQRQATKDAGEIAGLEVVRIINEPTASALAYGIDKQENQFLLVYDLGGGTLDVSIIEKVGDVFEVRAAHGNTHLGGDDFDDRLLQHVLKNFQKDHADIDISNDMKAIARLNRTVEDAKKRLSFDPFTKIVLENIAKKETTPLHINLEISRGEFVGLIEDLLESSKESIDIALKDAELSSDKIDKILLVGGSTRIPAVWDLIYKHMGKAPHTDVDPDLAVALGAAIQAGIIAGEERKAVLVDVSPYSLGIEYAAIKGTKLIPGFYRSIIKRNSTIPTSASEAFYTLHPDQDTVEIRVYQGDYTIASMNNFVGSFVFSGISPSKDLDQNREVVVQFDYDVDGIIHVSAMDRQTSRKEEGLTITESQIKLSDEDKQKARQSIETMEAKSADSKEHASVIEKFLEKASILQKKLSEEKKDEGILEEIKKMVEDLNKAKAEGGKADDKIINRLSELLYDYDLEE